MLEDLQSIVSKLLLHPSHNSAARRWQTKPYSDTSALNNCTLNSFLGPLYSGVNVDTESEVRNRFQPTDELTEKEVTYLVMESRQLFMSQPMLLEINAPLKICGDIHGQYSDLLRLFDLGEYPPDSNYLFLGDYVDRGDQSLETVSLLLAYKLLFPNTFFLLRGNHESSNINRIYGFFDECKRRFSIKLWKLFTDTFNCMPVAAVVEKRILCMHGGLSPELQNLDQIRYILRPSDVPDSGLICDLLWSDPSEMSDGWDENERGVSCTFGGDIVSEAIERFDIDLICRAHQVVEEGFKFFAARQLITVFSAPNYCGEFDNDGAFLVVNEDLMCGVTKLSAVYK